MPFAINDGVRIHYMVEGSGPPLVLHVGYMGRGRDWQRQDVAVVQALRDEYQLIMLDPRGFGESDKPHDAAAYQADVVAQDVVSVLDAIDVEKAHFWGYSRGAIEGFWLAALAPDRCESLTLGGAHPYLDGRSFGSPEVIEVLQTGSMQTYIDFLESRLGTSIPAEVRAEWLTNDPLALAAVSIAMRSEDGKRIDTSTIKLPALLYCGDKDAPHNGVRDVAGSMPNATFISLPGLDHGQTFRNPGVQAILPNVRAHLAGNAVPSY